MEALIGIVGTFNILLLSWLSIEVRAIRKDLSKKVDKGYLEQCWDRVNHHKHQEDTGEVVIPLSGGKTWE